MNRGFSPKFMRRYANLADAIEQSVGQYVSDVKTVDFPNESEQY